MFSLGFVGNSIDDRTKFSIEYTNNSSKKIIELKYVQEKFVLLFDKVEVECHEIDTYLKKFDIHEVLVDATSLGIPELALLIKNIKDICVELVFLYVEPEEYLSKNSALTSQEEFVLSTNIVGFESAGIPTISKTVSTEKERIFIFFLGFEESRLHSAIEAYDISSDEAKIIFGVPAFQVGWELRSIKRNINVLKEFNEIKSISYCGANSVESSLNLLRSFKDKFPNCDIHILPIGTKPHALGTLLYLEEDSNSSLLFDQPQKRVGRTTGISEIHFYKVIF